MTQTVHTSLSPEDIRRSAVALAPEIVARADEIASLRQLPADLVAKLKSAGVFRMPMPRAWGGPEMTPRQQCEVLEILSQADASVGWCVKIGSDSGWYAAFLDDSAARTLFADLDAVTAGQVPPNGRAERVPGGYRVSGRWRFGSGCTHADVIIGGAVILEGGRPVIPSDGPPGVPEMRVIMAPASHFQLHDTWYSTGLAGSGSRDYSVEGLFVPDAHTFPTMMRGVRRTEPLYGYGGGIFHSWAGVPLGLARRAIDLTREMIEGGRIVAFPPPPRPARTVPRVMTAIGLAEMRLGSARAYTYETLDAVWDELSRDGRLSPRLSRALILSMVNAFRTGREVAQSTDDTVGTTALFSQCPLDRLLRDAITMSQHLLLQESTLEMVGGVMLGGPSPSGWLY